MSAGGSWEYRGYRIEAYRGFRAAAIYPPGSRLALEKTASATGEDREQQIRDQAHAIIDAELDAPGL